MAGLIRNPTPAQIRAITQDPNTKFYPGATKVNAQGQPTDAQGNVVSSTGFRVPLLSDVGSAIKGVDDFLQLIAWIFHPLNLLRAVEFLTGLLIFWMGIKPYLDRSSRGLIGATGAGISRTVTRTVSATPAGRSMRVAQGRRMGTREGQREASRMQARREVTRTERESSARERHERETRTRRQARKIDL